MQPLLGESEDDVFEQEFFLKGHGYGLDEIRVMSIRERHNHIRRVLEKLKREEEMLRRSRPSGH